MSRGRPSVAEALRAHASVICLQHPSLPTAGVNSEPKKLSTTAPLCQGGNKTLKRPAVALHSSTLAWKIPWMEEPGRLQFNGVASSQI